MKSKDYLVCWDVYGDDSDCIVHFRDKEVAVKFMQEYGNESWFCLKRTLYFVDELDLGQVFDDVVVEVEGDWISYSPSKKVPSPSAALYNQFKEIPFG